MAPVSLEQKFGTIVTGSAPQMTHTLGRCPGALLFIKAIQHVLGPDDLGQDHRTALHFREQIPPNPSSKASNKSLLLEDDFWFSALHTVLPLSPHQCHTQLTT